MQRHGLPLHPRGLETDGGQRRVDDLSHRSGRPYPLHLKRDGETFQVNARHTIAVNDSTASLTAGLAGLGIVATSTFQAQPYIASGALTPLLLDWCAETIPLLVVDPPNRHLSTKLRVFVDGVAGLFARSDLMQRRCSLPAACQGMMTAAEKVSVLGGATVAAGYPSQCTRFQFFFSRRQPHADQTARADRPGGLLFAKLAQRQRVAGARWLSLSIDALGDDANALAAWQRRIGVHRDWQAAVPTPRDSDALVGFMRGLPVNAATHTAQVFCGRPRWPTGLPHRRPPAARLRRGLGVARVWRGRLNSV